MDHHIIILDFGSQYTQVIARRVRECHVYSEVLPYHTPAERIAELKPAGLILSGGPASVYAEGAPLPDRGIFALGVPILGICYGMQLLAHCLGGRVARAERREYGVGKLFILRKSGLFNGVPDESTIWNSHADHIKALPRGFVGIGRSDNARYAAIEDSRRRFFGLQFHPEVTQTHYGKKILENFILAICGASKNWTMRSFIEQSCHHWRKAIGKERVVLGLSGGVDSSVTAALLKKAIGKQLECIFVDNGLLRYDERAQVERVFRKVFRTHLHVVDASARFLKALRGVVDPERKRKIIGREFIRVFEAEARKLGKITYLAQGTLYPDVIESVPINGNPAALIKSHHNVGGLPRKMAFKLIEPLRQLFKDEVRELGERLGLPREMLYRHPFPGPGLAVRCLGAVSEDRLEIIRRSDRIAIEEIREAGWYDKIWQAFTVLLPVRSVGVMGDQRTYHYTVALRAVYSTDGMTADWVPFPADLLARISTRIINEVHGVNRVVYDISSKPPATIEWE
ncbi:MAG: glutamine-hydrolyzing GMP synthase [Methylacidiphilales bacterium]|nr:glutamine-hydrolyzing GMP synthase [Candidatus Methylacidiphilales bacterium]MDW8349252.1 glutamine-hydrolyzing GMP synthase [Verrucomicrobiae bacterium]